MAISIGIIGFGALGGAVFDLLAGKADIEVTGVFARSPIVSRPGLRPVDTLVALLALRPDVVIECAGQAALRECAVRVLAAGSHLVAASVGALADEAFLQGVLAACKAGGAELRIPSGAMVGIDGLAAARETGLDRVTYRGTMPPHALKNFESAGGITARTMVFDGNAREAAARFPKNANLTATIALAGIGFEQTRVELYVDPQASANVHELAASGAFGAFDIKVSGRRISEASPSSRIVAGSLVQVALGSNYTLLRTN